MAAIDWTYVLKFDSGLSAVDSDLQTDILAYVNAKVNATLFDGEDGSQTKMARGLLAAHMGTVFLPGDGGAAGPVTKDRAGDLETVYANLFANETDPLFTTKHGQTFAMLAKSSANRVPFTV